MASSTPKIFWDFLYDKSSRNYNSVPIIVPYGNSTAGDTYLPATAADNNKEDSDAITLGEFATEIESTSRSNSYRSNIDSANSNFTDINIVRDFYWTNHPVAARDSVPKIVMRERRIKTSAFASNILYSALNTAEASGDIIRVVSNTPSVKAARKEILSLVSSATDKISGFNFNENLSHLLDKLRRSVEFETLNSKYIDSYNGLFITESTGFIYTFPLALEEGVNSLGMSNKFGDYDTSKGGIGTPTSAEKTNSTFREKLGSYLKMIPNLPELFSSVNNILSPGTYFEKSQEYGFGDAPAYTWDVTFHLSNTGDYANTMKNWNFVFMFMYQNTPARRTRSVVDPPCIYEVFTEGMGYAPYAYISNIKIEMLGRTRSVVINMDQSQPNGDVFGPVKTVVPEAYQISFTVNGFNPKTRNFQLANIDPNNTSVVNTSVSNPVSAASSAFTKAAFGG